MTLRGRTSVLGAMKRNARKSGALVMRALAASALLCVSVVTSSAASPDPLAVAFGTMPGLWGVRMSPDGSKVSLLQMHPDELPILRIFDLVTGQVNLALVSTKDGFDIQWCDWANDERLLCGFSAVAKGWDAYGVTRLVAVNADGSAMKVLLQRKLRGEFAQFQDQVVDWLVDDPKRVLVVMPNNKGATLKPLDIYSGGTGSAIERHSGFVSWISDGRGFGASLLVCDRGSDPLELPAFRQAQVASTRQVQDVRSGSRFQPDRLR